MENLQERHHPIPDVAVLSKVYCNNKNSKNEQLEITKLKILNHNFHN
jgi:hypothetical protein